jgi:hypothetical protein
MVGRKPVRGSTLPRGSQVTLRTFRRRLEGLRRALSEVAGSRLADTMAWAHARWLLAEAQGAQQRADALAEISRGDVEVLDAALTSAERAFGELQSLADVPWKAERIQRSALDGQEAR